MTKHRFPGLLFSRQNRATPYSLKALSMPLFLHSFLEALTIPTFTALPLRPRPRLRVHSATTSTAYHPQGSPLRRSMSTTLRISQPHEERTAEEPREKAIHQVVLSKISPVNPTIRLLQLCIPNGGHIKAPQFLAGQWLDVHIPSLPQAGGFTITSTPRNADSTLHPRNLDTSPTPSAVSSPMSSAYLELAVQKTPNPPAAWLWRPEGEILGTELRVRVGGSFVWPPPGVDTTTIQRIVFVAGGVGINPLISILSHLHETPASLPPSVQFLYTTRPPPPNDPNILFLPRLRRFFSTPPIPLSNPTLDFFPTHKTPHHSSPAADGRYCESRRLDDSISSEIVRGASESVDVASSSTESATRGDRKLQLFLTGTTSPQFSTPSTSKYLLKESLLSPEMATHWRRIGHGDLLNALGPVEGRGAVVVYICGPPGMTDEFVRVVSGAEGMERGRVFCEKWW